MEFKYFVSSQIHDDQVTPDNKTFIKEILHDKYGPPALIKGVQTYKNASQSLVKIEELEKHEWKPEYRRTGVLARKIGQYPLWLKSGVKIRTTLLQVSVFFYFLNEVKILLLSTL